MYAYVWVHALILSVWSDSWNDIIWLIVLQQGHSPNMIIHSGVQNSEIFQPGICLGVVSLDKHEVTMNDTHTVCLQSVWLAAMMPVLQLLDVI